MKKLLVCVAVVGVAVGVIYLLYKTKKEENISSKPMEGKFFSKTVNKDETPTEEKDTVQDMYAAKGKSAQSVHERHTEAAGIMASAFTNIMKDVETVEVVEKSDETVIDTKDIETISELDSLTDELDELSK